MKKIIYLLLVLPFWALGQTTTENYIKTTTYKGEGSTLPQVQISYFDGLDDTGKVVANPTLGYGKHTLEYATGASKEVFKLGLSANKTGISIYLMGIKDKTLLKSMFQDRLGKAKVTGYCIRFGKLADIDADILMDVIANVI
jgi:hypothetical protein